MSFETEIVSHGEDRLLASLQAEAEWRFDMEKVQANEEIYRLLSEVQDISGGDYQVESTGNPVVENMCSAHLFDGLTEKLNSSFSKDLLYKCFISRITIRPDIVHLAIGKGLYLTRDEYEAWRTENPRIDEYKVRAENFTTFKTSGWLRDNYDIDRPIPLPIVIYGFNEREGESVTHLRSVEFGARERLYAFGTVAHEIGHHIFQFVLTDEQKKTFVSLAKEALPLTEYAKSYQGKGVYSEEQFCEAVRLMTTNPTYLKESTLDLYHWLTNTLPGIRPVTSPRLPAV